MKFTIRLAKEILIFAIFISILNFGIDLMQGKNWVKTITIKNLQNDPAQAFEGGKGQTNTGEAETTPEGQICDLEAIECEGEYTGEAVFTSYNPSEDQTDSDPFTMASTKRVYEGALACPIKFKLGTKIKVEGLGIFTCEDRMGERFRNEERFDVFRWERKDNFKRELSYKVL
jgi:3D (Asp-Asp-Asp) domain-containing protein